MDETLSNTSETISSEPVKTKMGMIREGFRRFRAAIRRKLYEHRHEIIIFSIIGLAAFIFLLPYTLYTIPAGHVGVLWSRFGQGTLTNVVYGEGVKLTYPWNRFYIYDTRLQQVEREVQVLSSDGLTITLDLAWRFHIIAKDAAKLHKYFGPDYRETMIAPLVSARTRDVIAIYQPEELYTGRRLQIQNEINAAVKYDLSKRYSIEGHTDFVFLDDILIKSITLPPGIQAAIVRKNTVSHEVDEYTFRLMREEKEAERKRIEAVGIRNFQEIVSNGMSDAYLRWRGIEATVDLAKSANAKVVVVGNSKNGLPLILNTDSKDAPSTPEVTPATKAAASIAPKPAPPKPSTEATPPVKTANRISKEETEQSNRRDSDSPLKVYGPERSEREAEPIAENSKAPSVARNTP